MEKFKWRYASREDYDRVLTRWWGEWEFPVPPVECLPERGIVVSDKEGDLYGGFLYLTDGGIGWIEWVVSDRRASTTRKRGALEYLTGIFTRMARKEGMYMIFTSTNRPGFVNGLKKCGFLPGDANMYQLVKSL